MKIKLIRKFKGLTVGDYEVKDIVSGIVWDGISHTGVVVEKDKKEVIVPIDLVEFL